MNAAAQDCSDFDLIVDCCIVHTSLEVLSPRVSRYSNSRTGLCGRCGGGLPHCPHSRAAGRYEYMTVLIAFTWNSNWAFVAP
jgi:hypothetical protein